MTMIDISPIFKSRFSFRKAIASASMLAVAATLPLPGHVAWAQESASAELRAAVRSLAGNPENVSALIDAGEASLEMGDADAAAGFFLRAEAVSPRNGRVKAGLAKAKLRQEDPVRAISLFEEAQTLGQSESDFAADKGLAYDLIGDFASAQKSYRIAELYKRSPSLTLRMAISYDLAGDRDRATQLLNSLLTDNNSGAWRAQSFLYAAHGEMDKARAVAASFLGPSRANQFDEYLEKMPRLSVAQQMAAIHFGHFPRSSYGVDNAAIAAIQQNRGITQPQPKPAEKRDGKSKARPPAFIDFRGRKQANVAYTAPVSAVAAVAAAPPQPRTPAPPPVRQGTANGSNSPDAALAQAGRNAGLSSNTPPASPIPASRPSPSSSQMGVISQPAPSPSTRASPAPQMGVISEPAQTVPQSSPTQQMGVIAKPATQPAPTPQPATPASSSAWTPVASTASRNVPQTSPVAAQAATASKAPANPTAGAIADAPNLAQMPATQAPRQSSAAESDARDLAALMSDISIPESEKQQDVVPVTEDLIESEAPRKADSNNRPAAVPAYPARHWVQIATGSNLKALAYDYRRFARRYDALFEGKTGWTSAWGGRRRLVVGPFDSFDAASAWQKDYQEKGGDSMVWRSDDGTVVDPLPTR